MIEVVIISDNTATQNLLSDQLDFNINKIIPSQLEELVGKVISYNPDIVILEQSSDNIDIGIVCHFLASLCPNAQRLIMLDEPPTLELLKSIGFKAHGFVTLDQHALLPKAIRVVQQGEAWLPRKLVAEMLNYFSSFEQISPVQEMSL